MKTNLTVTIESDLIPKAKHYARDRGLSVSALVEDCLRNLVEHEEPSFADRWLGKFVLAERDDERYRALVRKYCE